MNKKQGKVHEEEAWRVGRRRGGGLRRQERQREDK
jgi:hypothetical protein